ncbi:hypothetical protein CYY_002364 [Polysphondylium violaceum]|uniref:RRM domain-containing protein n=1 Tax=Polysphondylium violaceum TaxID=133409 RepID=A0A8J4PWP7_9MYCE|nr:hypothetical protein CYY_002364 [Polysphondylium violaceum]
MSHFTDVSLDQFISDNKSSFKSSRRGGGGGGNRSHRYNRQHNQHQNEDSSSKNNSDNKTSSLDVLESSLDDIVKSQSVKKSFRSNSHHKSHHNNNIHQHRHQHHNNHYNNNSNNHRNQTNFQVTLGGGGNNARYNNGGLFSRKQYQHGSNNTSRPAPKIDHTFFDPRGIRDYSQAKNPAALSMNGRDARDDIDEQEYDDNGMELNYGVLVKNLPSTVSNADVTYLFGLIGSLKDFEFNSSRTEVIVIFKKREHALASIDRYNQVELDGNVLTLEEVENEPTFTVTTGGGDNSNSNNNKNDNIDKVDEATTTSTSTTANDTLEENSPKDLEMQE